MKIKIISASVRTGRNSHRVALYFQQYIRANDLAEVEILDLLEYNFPLFEERLQYMSAPSQGVLDFSSRVKEADGLIIVTPEYNGGYPASLKNVVDLLYPEWKKKPVAISTVSDGVFGGTQVITSLVFSFFKIGALLVPAMFPVPKVLETFEEDGTAKDAQAVEKRSRAFVKELIWCIDARKKMESPA